jgi:hypothetical protein
VQISQNFVHGASGVAKGRADFDEFGEFLRANGGNKSEKMLFRGVCMRSIADVL